jgi:K+:H+ antiporter
VVGSLSGSPAEAIWPIAGGALYVFAVFVVARPLLRRLADDADDADRLSPSGLAVMLGLLALGSWFTDLAGIYSVFGAFMLGVAVPRGVLTRDLYKAIAPMTTALLVPLYFVYSGLNARLGLLDTPWLWTLSVLVFVAACAGKGLARGAGHRDAHERARHDGTRPAQHRAATRPDHANALHDARLDGHRHHAHGLSPLRVSQPGPRERGVVAQSCGA